ncbi:hypothetical protein SIN8267_02541 [Sinobacterium norvegicum]|uniref:Lon N-terminal domain-containing protein n=1 Tax=Sinobacterium norvegicum TaxID=1641715 RepID=A0ABN8EIZ4_9GAMM|nr:LON peptidase substrate-binding domain-containing protein [Sinobacterium norvegicum]CAH0992421.1 hypothetical protein SIN8267_02541 [Sinobacterium norvegicum]
MSLDIFPLNEVLLPNGRMMLSIFEPRYLQLVSRCLKENKPFVSVKLQRGDEVANRAYPFAPAVEAMGCLCYIVDWQPLEHDKLLIVIEGTGVCRVGDLSMDKTFALSAEVKEYPRMSDIDGEVEIAESFMPLRETLSRHKSHQLLNYPAPQSDAQLYLQLAQMLPIEPMQRYQYLHMTTPTEAASLLEQHLYELSH